ncbi:DEAD/DEAH box helicase [Polycladidibacter stylochi]|uniref:DEAD/DEAH box helicase n=1 Tax=Polycladidibacter stylochi TaxID=1807766 RepID=UPI00082F3EDF|nr:DEAD/DEAH box helicase [Pseudovibrio stylochi]
MGFLGIPHPQGAIVQLCKPKILGRKKTINLADWDRSLSKALKPTYRLLMNLLAEGAGEKYEEGVLIPTKTLLSLPDNQLSRLGIPPLAGLSLSLSMNGRVDSTDSNLILVWQDSNSRTITPDFKGPFLQSNGEWRRLSKFMYELQHAAREFNASAGQNFEDRLPYWSQVQQYLNELDHGVDADKYLNSLRIYQAGALTLDVRETQNGPDFIPVMLPKGAPAELLETDDGPNTSELDSANYHENEEATNLLPPLLQDKFDSQFSQLRGQTPPAMVLEKGAYLLIEKPLQTAIDIVKSARTLPLAGRREFLRNPRTVLSQALGSEGDSLAQEIFVETEQYSERIQGLGLWEKPNLPWLSRKSTQWLPERFYFTIGTKTKEATPETIENLRISFEQAKENDLDVVQFQGESFKCADVEKCLENLSPQTIVELGDIEQKEQSVQLEPDEKKEAAVLLIQENLESNDYTANFSKRSHIFPIEFPNDYINGTIPKSHQMVGFDWVCRAWKEGWPGVLLADDMGVGKTFQALAFLAWIRQNKLGANNSFRALKGPILIVAPTALLANWRKEAEIHLLPDTLGQCCEVYGKGLKSLKRKQCDITKGEDLLHIEQLREAEWVLTTYDTLALYHQSFARIAFSIGIFDEIQKIKSPDSINSHAAKTVNIDFVVGMTGTPIENRIEDLWCIMDRIAPGYLEDLKSFSKTYGDENAESLNALKSKLDEPQGNAPPIMLRRMKEQISTDLPNKDIKSYKINMSTEQARAYDGIIQKAKSSDASPRFILQTLHEMRSISLHPNGHSQSDLYDKKQREEWIKASARLAKTIQILEEIESKGEKALVFLEDRIIQQSLSTALAEHFCFAAPPVIINGEMTGLKRQEHVDAFQNLPKGFAVMILSPKAAGIGLTITAANHVIHLSRWWNPAVEDQCNDRTYRIGQKKDVTIHVPMAVHPTYGQASFDIRLDELLKKKRNLSQNMLAPPVCEGDSEALYSQVIKNN